MKKIDKEELQHYFESHFSGFLQNIGDDKNLINVGLESILLHSKFIETEEELKKNLCIYKRIINLLCKEFGENLNLNLHDIEDILYFCRTELESK